MGHVADGGGSPERGIEARPIGPCDDRIERGTDDGRAVQPEQNAVEIRCDRPDDLRLPSIGIDRSLAYADEIGIRARVESTELDRWEQHRKPLPLEWRQAEIVRQICRCARR